MRRVNFKSGLAIIIYSLILSLVLGVGLYRIKGSFSNMENKTNIKDAKAIIVNANIDNKDNLIYKVLYEDNNLIIKDVNKDSINNQILKSKRVVDVDEIGRIYLKTGFEDIL